jgi:hypothetical protein
MVLLDRKLGNQKQAKERAEKLDLKDQEWLQGLDRKDIQEAYPRYCLKETDYTPRCMAR